MSRRYDQCDQTCTVDCGHCKGQGPPKDFDSGAFHRWSTSVEHGLAVALAAARAEGIAEGRRWAVEALRAMTDSWELHNASLAADYLECVTREYEASKDVRIDG